MQRLERHTLTPPMNADDRYPLLERQRSDVVAWRSGATVTAGTLLAEAQALADRLPRRRYVINLQQDRYRFLRAFCASVIAGQCTLMPPNRQPGTLQQLQDQYPDCYTLGPDDLLDSDITRAGEGVADVPGISGSQLCAIAFTSGSTGAPRPNEKHWETLRTGSLSNRELLLQGLPNDLALLATVPAQHMWGLETSVLLPLFSAVSVASRSPFFPQDIADALHEIPAPRALVSSPVHLQALSRSGVQVPDLKCIFTATAPLTQALARDLEQAFRCELRDVFGCSESGILALRRTSNDPLWTLSKYFQLQPSDDGFEIRASHLPDAVTMPDRIELCGPQQFRWLGRQQDMINIGGKRGSLADLNQRLLRIPGVRDGVIFLPAVDSDRLAALVVADGLTSADILAALKAEVEPLFLPRPVLFVDQLPRQETGKITSKDVEAMYDEARR